MNSPYGVAVSLIQEFDQTEGEEWENIRPWLDP